MADDDFLTPARRDALLALLAVGLLLAPVWVSGLHINDERYRYESVAVATDGTEMEFETAPGTAFVGISDRIACAEGRWGRACVLEQFVAANGTVPTGIYASLEGGFRDDVFARRYAYAYVNGTVYEVGAAPNATATGHGGHRLDLALRPYEADRALHFESVDVEDAPAPVREAARTGTATGYVEEVPATTIELEDGSYRRVFIAGTNYPADHESGTQTLLTVGLPIVGLGLLGRSWGRFEVDVSVRHLGDG